MSPSPQTELAAIARRHDPDRFLSALFVPAARREAAFALIAFNHELARALEMPSARSGAGAVATLIRLQWWREVVENSRADWHAHPVAQGVRALLDAGLVPVSTLEAVIAAREAETEPAADIMEWRSTMLGGPGGLQRAFGELLAVPSDLLPRIAAAGAAYATGSLRRHLAAVLRTGRCPLPDTLLHAAGTDRDTLAHDPQPDRLAAVADALAVEGRLFLEQAGRLRLPRHQLAAALPLVLAARDLRPARPDGARGVGDRLAVLRAYAAGRAGAGR